MEVGDSAPYGSDAFLSNGKEMVDVYIPLWFSFLSGISVFTKFNIKNYYWFLQVFYYII